MDDQPPDEETELPSGSRRERSTTPGKDSTESKRQRTVDRQWETFMFEGKELRRVTAYGEPVARSSEEHVSVYDDEMRIGPDHRDPRVHHGPCAGNHLEYYQITNTYGRWRHCYRCGVILEYTPERIDVMIHRWANRGQPGSY